MVNAGGEIGLSLPSALQSVSTDLVESVKRKPPWLKANVESRRP